MIEIRNISKSYGEHKVIDNVSLKINDGEIDKDIITKRLIIFVIVFAICMYFECGYLKNAQKGMINIYNSTYEENNTK